MVLISGRSLRGLVAAACLTLPPVLAPTPAAAQSSIGFTGGASIDPEQVYAGVFWQSDDIAGRFRLRPGIDGGFGDGLRLGTINLDFTYLFPLGSQWSLLTGGGPVVVLTRLADDRFDQGTDLTAGLSWLFGFHHENGFLVDVRLGGGRTPALKAGVGWALKFR